MNNINDMYYSNDNDFSYRKTKLASPSEGFKRGNIFLDIYSPYKKDMYNFVPKNERQKLLLEIMENCFYAHELNLYLDNYPMDKDKINLYNEYSKKSNELISKYNKKYEPLILNDLDEVPWEWVDSPWPWEGV